MRLREPTSRIEAIAIAIELYERGHIHTVADGQQAQDVMVEAYFRAVAGHARIALVTSTNDEADAVNGAIQQRRIDAGQLTLHRIAVGMYEQRILEGDVVQTRRNDRDADVENRALWTVRRIHADRIELASITDSADMRTVSADYAADHIHLAYASTVHGIQGETTDTAIVGPGVDAAGLYVGMTRGRIHNEAIALVRPGETAVDVIANQMTRGLPEITIEDSRQAVRAELGRTARDPLVAAEGAPDELNDWIRDSTRALAGQYARAANDEATSHGRGESGPPPEIDARYEELRARIARRQEQLDRLIDELSNTPRHRPTERAADVAPAPVGRVDGLSR